MPRRPSGRATGLRLENARATAYLLGFGFSENDLKPLSGKTRRALCAAIKVELRSLVGAPPSRIREGILTAVNDAINDASAKNQGRTASAMGIARHIQAPYDASEALADAIAGIGESLSTS